MNIQHNNSNQLPVQVQKGLQDLLEAQGIGQLIQDVFRGVVTKARVVQTD